MATGDGRKARQEYNKRRSRQSNGNLKITQVTQSTTTIAKEIEMCDANKPYHLVSTSANYDSSSNDGFYLLDLNTDEQQEEDDNCYFDTVFQKRINLATDYMIFDDDHDNLPSERYVRDLRPLHEHTNVTTGETCEKFIENKSKIVFIEKCNE
ncbi:unnamed protein product [Didymodactylos carnosus]|uniref:Uncharacterized protein n=1 Tax=Didymodactylos carnosus TaxID=1234261 RepID=A0A8S2VX48_9BILA|nr:unnamed protein product [Didymodactylos carnosus]